MLEMATLWNFPAFAGCPQRNEGGPCDLRAPPPPGLRGRGGGGRAHLLLRGQKQVSLVTKAGGRWWGHSFVSNPVYPPPSRQDVKRYFTLIEDFQDQSLAWEAPVYFRLHPRLQRY